MVRIKKGLVKRRKHKKILQSTKGYRGAKSRLVRSAKEAQAHAGNYAFAGRKMRKRHQRRLWITQINAGLRSEGISYNLFLKSLKNKNVELDRKILADILISDPSTFKRIVSKVK
ncbi:MAG: 50S ribosomal protein L20 [Candidatus Woykebacteria bacterium]